MRRSVIFGIATLAALAIGTPAMAAKKPPTGPTGTTFQLKVLTGGDQVPSWGDDITFDVATSATPEPHVDVTCSQGGVTVYGATTGFYASYPWPWTQVMSLKSQDWSGGDADCTARLYAFNGRRTTTLGTISFLAQS
jgi:hypothetical protein